MCTVCAHPLRIQIESDLLACPSAAAVAANHHLPLEDVKKHQARLHARIEYAQRQLEQIRLADSLDRLNLLLEKTLKVLAKAEEKDDLKLMLQATREAERLTKMIQAMSPELEAASLFMETNNPNWIQTGTTPDIQKLALIELRQAIKRSLSSPCAGSELEDDLNPEPASPPVPPVPAGRKVRTSGQPRRPLISWLSARKEATIVGAATAPLAGPTAVESGGAGPG